MKSLIVSRPYSNSIQHGLHNQIHADGDVLGVDAQRAGLVIVASGAGVEGVRDCNAAVRVVRRIRCRAVGCEWAREG